MSVEEEPKDQGKLDFTKKTSKTYFVYFFKCRATGRICIGGRLFMNWLPTGAPDVSQLMRWVEVPSQVMLGWGGRATEARADRRN